MLSRTTNLLLSVSRHGNRRSVQQVRHSGDQPWTYREGPIAPKWSKNTATALNAFMWWWILWNAWHTWVQKPDFPYPDTSLWTDAELGIPQDI